MAVVRWKFYCVAAGDERGNLQPNYVCLRSAGDFLGIVSRVQLRLSQGRPFADSFETLKSPVKKSFRRYRTVSRYHGASCRRSFTQQHVMCESGFLFRKRPYRFLADQALGRAPSTICCRDQSLEGAEKSSGPDETLEPTKLASLTGNPSPAGRTAEQVDSVSSTEKMIVESDRAEYAGSPRNGSASVVSDESTNDVETGATPPEELDDYGSGGTWEEVIQYVTKISVPRQRYIPIPKVDLVNALLSFFFPANKDTSKFLSICSYLEIILHAEHKILLEEMRSDYSLTHSVQDGSKVLTSTGATNSTKLGTVSTERAQKHEIIGEQADWPLDSSDMEGSFFEGVKQYPLKLLTDLGTKFVATVNRQSSRYADKDDNIQEDSSRLTNDIEQSEAAAERFQKNIVRLLRGAEFEGISLRDLELTAALNSDYLLATPVDVDWKRTSSSNVKVFRRGYTKEEQKGLLLGEKFDYLQSLVLRQSFKGFTGPLLIAGRWCIQKWNSLWEDKEGRELAESVSGWLQEPLQLDNEGPLNATENPTDREAIKYDKQSQLDMPIWLAGRQAIPRYEAILSSAGSRGLLIRRILVRMGLLQMETPSQTLPVADEIVLEPHLRPNHLSRVSMKDIWLPASKAVAGGNAFKRMSAAFSVFFSRATLQEPAFKELVLLYNVDADGDSMEAGLQLQTYNRIPLPDLKIVFPNKKLRFRVLDTVRVHSDDFTKLSRSVRLKSVYLMKHCCSGHPFQSFASKGSGKLRLDITSIAGLLAFVVNYHFDDFFSSPSAFVLDVIAASALVVLVTRVAFGYKQVWDRYQLLVNKTLYQKTGARGFGVVQFLLDESEEQQFKEAILVFTVLVHQGKAEGMTTKQLADSCERMLYYRCREQVEMPVRSALSTLLKFGLIVYANETSKGDPPEEVRFRALSYEEGLTALERHWVVMPSSTALWN